MAFFRGISCLTSFRNHKNLILNESLRHYRKPQWLPIAKTKLFRIPTRPVIPVEEYEELKRIHNQYRSQMKAVRKYLHMLYIDEINSLSNINSERSIREEQIELDRCFKLNDEWNKKVAEEREEYFNDLREQQIKKANKVIENQKKIREHIANVAEQEIRDEIEKSKTYITLENLDDAIEKCLSSEVDFNYSIDLEGNQYHGRKTNPENLSLKAMGLD